MERGGAYPSYRRLPSSSNTSAGTPPPEPVKIAPRPFDGTAVAAGTKSDDDNNGGGGGGGGSSNANYYAGKIGGGGGKAEAPEPGGAVAVREQDRFMPIANVIRIMRRVLPTHAKIADDAKETIQECVSEYISFITSEANERCQQEQRKTITAEDLLWAMSKLGFDDYVEPLSLYLQRYREMEGDHRGSLRGEPLLTPLKRAASDSGLYGVPPPQYHAGAHDLQGGHHAIAAAQYFYAAQHGHPHLSAPVYFPGDPGGSGGSAANGGAGGGMVPGLYYRDAGSSSQAGSSQPHPGFDPFAPYK